MKKKIKYQLYKTLTYITKGTVRNSFVNKMNKYKTFVPDIMSYEYNRLDGEKIRNDYNFNEQLDGLMLSAALNKIKELDLKRKVREGKKINVCFLIDDIAKFSASSVYREMEKSDLFEPYILLYDHKDGSFCENDIIYKNHVKALQYFKNNNFDVYDCFDSDRSIIPLEKFDIDILFMTAPYLDYHDTILNNIYLNINYLVCYLSYYFPTINNYNYHYNNRRIASCWKNFVASKEDYKEFVKYSKYCGTNCILTGYPKLDVYQKPINECKINKKIDNGKPIVIYAPHHSIMNDWEPCNLSTFHLYHEYFLNLAKSNPDVNFVFKPHPVLILKVVEKNIMTTEEYQNYINEWDSLPNGLYVYDGEYIDLFRKSSLLITDCGSFIAEWLPTNAPCMYLINPERNQKQYFDGFFTSTRKILEKYYLCHNTDDISRYFDLIINKKEDPLKNDRINVQQEIFINIGKAGKTITTYLENILRD